jgi:hypothetical protein
LSNDSPEILNGKTIKRILIANSFVAALLTLIIDGLYMLTPFCRKACMSTSMVSVGFSSLPPAAAA